jgi:hypothetical protein
MILIWAGALGILGLPALGLGIWAAARSPRAPGFWVALGMAALASVAGQYVSVLTPFVRKGMVDWNLLIDASFGWHLLVPVVAAAVVWLAGRGVHRAGAGGVAAGLLVSVPLAIALALPVMLIVPGMLHLRFEP